MGRVRQHWPQLPGSCGVGSCRAGWAAAGTPTPTGSPTKRWIETLTPTGDAGAGLAYPGTPYPVHDTAPPRTFPPGHGAIAVRAWCPREAHRFTLAPIVGVDGQPAMYGWGRALIVVPAGERLVEVQYIEPRASRLVDVGEGSTVELEYAASRDGRAPRAPRSTRAAAGRPAPDRDPAALRDHGAGGRRRRAPARGGALRHPRTRCSSWRAWRSPVSSPPSPGCAAARAAEGDRRRGVPR